MPRRPPHFKVFASIQNHHHTLGVFDDDALLAMYVRAGILAIERYADRTGDSFLLSHRDLERVTQTWPISNALRKIERLTSATRLRLECSCGATAVRGKCPSGAGCRGYRLYFPNLAKKQFSRDENGAEKGPSSSSASSATTTSSKEHASRGAEAPSAEKRSPLLNLLSGKGVEADEKEAWFKDQEEVILAEAEVVVAKAPKGTVKAVRAAELKRLTIRYWKHYLQGERKYRGAGKRQRAQEAAAAWEAEHGTEYQQELAAGERM